MSASRRRRSKRLVINFGRARYRCKRSQRLIDITIHMQSEYALFVYVARRTALIERDKRLCVCAAREENGCAVYRISRKKRADRLTHHLITRVAMRERYFHRVYNALIDGCWGERGVENGGDYW